MKCENCGYISSREFYRCPYCGHVHEESEDVLKTRLSFGVGFSIQIRTIIYAVLFNLFGASILIDWFLGFKYAITLWSFIVCFGAMTIISIVFMRKKILVSICERIDFFLILALILASVLCRFDGVFDLRVLMATIVIPAYLLFATMVSIYLLFRRKASQMRPLLTELLLIVHAFIATILFVFLLVNKYSVQAGINNPAFSFMQYGMTKDNLTTMYIVEEVLIFLSFGISWAYLINYNVILVGVIARKVKNIYGGSGD